MRDRLSPTRQIRLAELLVGVPYVLVWAIFLIAWPGDDVVFPFLFAAAAGVAVIDIGNHAIDWLLPGRPKNYRRPWKAVAIGLLIAVALVVLVVVAHPLANDGSQRHQFALVGLICLATIVAVLLWPPQLDESDRPATPAAETEPHA